MVFLRDNSKATNITIHQIKNYSFYLKDVFLCISMKKNQQKNIFNVCNHHCGKRRYNLKTLSLIDVIFQRSHYASVGDKTERLLLHIVFALFLSLACVIYLSIYFWNSEIVGLIGGDYMITVGRTEILSHFLPASRQCYEFLMNYILRLYVKSFISARRDPSFVLSRRNFPT